MQKITENQLQEKIKELKEKKITDIDYYQEFKNTLKMYKDVYDNNSDDVYEYSDTSSKKELGYLMQDLYFFTSELQELLEELDHIKEIHYLLFREELRKKGELKDGKKEELNEYQLELLEKEKEITQEKNKLWLIAKRLLKFQYMFIGKNRNFKVKDLLSYIEDYYYDWSEINSGAHPGCDCGCGGDTIDWDNLYNEIGKKEKVINELSLYFHLIKKD